MKKTLFKLSSIIASVLVLTTVFTGCKKQTDSNLTKVRVNEVTRSIFYAPMYAAINEGFFKEEGLEIDLTTGEGADAIVTNTQLILKCKLYLLLLRLKKEETKYNVEYLVYFFLILYYLRNSNSDQRFWSAETFFFYLKIFFGTSLYINAFAVLSFSNLL